MQLPRTLTRLTVALAVITALLGGVLIASSAADLSTQIQSSKSTAANLQNQIKAESQQIAKTAGGVAAAQQQLATVQANLDQHIAQLRSVQTKLMTAKGQLLVLEQKLHLASTYLAANLRASYESGSPNLVDVILNSNGFSNLLNQVNYIKDAQSKDTQIVRVMQIARTRVQQEAMSLGRLELQDRDLTNQILTQRNQAAVIEAGLVQQQITEQTQQAHTKAKLASVNAQTQALQKKLNAIIAAQQEQARLSAQQAATQVNQQVGGLPINSSGTVQPPPGAPQAVKEMIYAGNAIATLPYIWGGGHGSFTAAGYDCSGSVSYVLAAAGLLSTPEVSGSFESYGDPGPGQWVTIYANAGHVWMQIAGWRFDTVALNTGGSRWSQGGGEYAGFVVRHPVGL